MAVTKQVNNIAQLTDRLAGYSNKLKLPKTKTNNLIFEGANVMQQQSQAAYLPLNCQLIVDGYDLVGNGVGRLLGVSSTDYDLVVYTGIVGFFDAIGDDTLRALSMPSLTHVRDYGTIKASLSNTSGFVYAVADYFDDSPNSIMGLATDVDTRYLLPCVYLRDIWDAIFSTYGFTYEAETLLADDRFNKAVIPLNAIADNLDLNDDLFVKGTSSADASKVFSGAGLGGWLHLVEFTTVEGNVLGNGAFSPITITGGINYTGNMATYDVSVNGVYDLAAQMKYTTTATAAGALSLACTRAGSTVLETLDTVVILPSQSGTVVDFAYSGEFAAGDRVFIYGASLLAANLTVNAPCFLSVTADELTYGYGSTWYTDYLLPPIKIKTLLKDVAQLFGLVYDQKLFSNTIQAFSMNDVKQNIPIATDWSDKLDVSAISQAFRVAGYAQENWLRYSDDDSLQDSEAYDGFLTSNNENLKKSTTIIKPSFAATDSVPRLDGESIANIPLFSFIDNSATYEPNQKVKARIGVINRLSKSIDITDGTSTDTIASAAILTFGDNLNALTGDEMLADYYGTVFDMLQDSKVLSASFNLAGSDVSEIDFSVPIYIEYFNAYFYLNKVQAFISNRLTTCQLIKIQ